MGRTASRPLSETENENTGGGVNRAARWQIAQLALSFEVGSFFWPGDRGFSQQQEQPALGCSSAEDLPLSVIIPRVWPGTTTLRNNA